MDSSSPSTPAATALFVFIAALLIHPHLVNVAHASVAGLLIAAMVPISIRNRDLTKMAIALLAFVLGLHVASGEQSEIAGQRKLLASIEDSRFVTVRAAIGIGWQRDGERYRLEAENFTVDLRGAQHRIRRPIVVTLSGRPDAPGLSKWIVARGFLRESESGMARLSVKSPRLLQYEDTSPLWSPALWNRIACLRLDSYVEANPDAARSAALVKAIVFARSDELSDEIRESYRRGGSYHLLVFSGMQIAIAAGLLTALLRNVRAPRLGDAALLVVAFIAPGFAGNQPSVSRAAWMIGLYAVSRLLHRPTPIENLFFVSALTRLIAHPEDLGSPGFALTYAATAGLIFIGKPLSKRAPRHWLRPFAFGLGAEIATTPLTLSLMNLYVIGSSLVTIVIAPLLTLMLIAGSLAAGSAFISPRLTRFLLGAISQLDRVATAVNRLFDEWLHCAGIGIAPPLALLGWSAMAFILSRGITKTTRFGSRVRILLFTGSVLVPIVSAIAVNMRATHVRAPAIEFLDVGQGDSILVRSKTKAVLIDGGGWQRDDDFGRAVLLPLLLDRGVRHLDAVALSHPDPDHCGGLPAVLRELSVDELWISSRHLKSRCAADLIRLSRTRSVTVRLSDYVSTLTIGDLQFRPLSARLHFKRATVNNSSVVYSVTAGGVRFLLTGDIEKEAERLLAEEHRESLRADVLKVAHHGSRNSTTSAFLDAVAPRIAIISSGRKNPFGHPHPRVLEELRSRRIRVSRTDLSGSIRVEIDQGSTTARPEFDTPR